MQAPLPPEARLLLLAAGGERNRSGLQAFLKEDLDWNGVLALANRENAVLPLWRLLKGAHEGGIPGPVAGHLAKLADVWEFRMLHLEALLHGILRVFRGHEIDVLLLKGSGLAYTAYGSFTQRPMSDLDLLVRPERAEEAWRLAQANGWNWDAAEYPLDQYAGHHHLSPLDDAAGSGTKLEIHVDLLRPGHRFTLPDEDMWHARQEVRVDDLPLWIPNPTHQLLHTCLHFAWAHAMRFKTYLTMQDLCTFVASDQLSWEELIGAARRSQLTTCCYWPLRIARDVACAPVPDSALAALRPRLPEPVLRRLERHFELHLFPFPLRCPSVGLSALLHRIAIGRGRADEEAMELMGACARRELALTSDGPLPLVDRVRNQLAQLGDWSRYLRVVVGRSDAA